MKKTSSLRIVSATIAQTASPPLIYRAFREPNAEISPEIISVSQGVDDTPPYLPISPDPGGSRTFILDEQDIFDRVKRLTAEAKQPILNVCNTVCEMIEAGRIVTSTVVTRGDTVVISFTRAGAEAAQPEPLAPPPPLTDDELSALTAHAKANPWHSPEDDKTKKAKTRKPRNGVSASAFISETFANWLTRGISRTDLKQALEAANQEKLLTAYAVDVNRYPKRRLKGLYVKPHKAPAGTPIPLSVRRIDQLTQIERDERREQERRKKARQGHKIYP